MKEPFIKLVEMYDDFKSKTGGMLRAIDKGDFLMLGDAHAERILRVYSTQTHGIALVKINMFEGTLPKNFRSVIHAMYAKHLPDQEHLKKHLEGELSKFSEPEDTSAYRCPRCHTPYCQDHTLSLFNIPVPREGYGKYVNHYYDIYSDKGQYHARYAPEVFHHMNHSPNHYFNTKYHISNCVNINLDTGYEYKIEHPKIVTNHQSGWILLAYSGTRLDDMGLRMVPNDTYSIDAVIAGIRMYHAEREYDRDHSQKNLVYKQDSERSFLAKMRKAKIELKVTSMDEDLVFYENHWRKMLPNMHSWWNFDRIARDAYQKPIQTYNF